MKGTVSEYLDIAVIIVILGMCLGGVAVIMKEWTVPIAYNNDKSVIVLTNDVEQSIQNAVPMKGSDVKAALMSVDMNTIKYNRMTIEVYKRDGSLVNNNYEIITVNADWVKHKGENIKKLCTQQGSWELDNKFSWDVDKLYFDYDRDVWVYRLLEG